MEKYYDYAIRFEMILEELRSKCDIEKVADEVCSLRGYIDPRMKQTLVEIGIFHIDYYDSKEYSLDSETLSEFGLLSKQGNFLLEGGYCIPIRDPEGYLIAIVGWFPGRPTKNKYITALGKYFRKSTSLFNIENAIEIGKFELLFIVEGIFDCLAMRSIGLPCVSIQGSEITNVKRMILKMFKKKVSIPDNDEIGKEELIKWGIEGNNTYIDLNGSVEVGDRIYKIKDCDDLIKCFDNIDLVMLEYAKSDKKIERLNL